MKALGPNTFGLLKQSRKAAKVAYRGLKELVKFVKFPEVENTPAANSINDEVAEEHVAPKPKFQFSFEEIEVSDDDEEEAQEKELSENDFENYIQQSISILDEDISVTPPSMSERERDTIVQSSSPTPEQMDALIAELQQTARKPPQTIHVDTEPPSRSDLVDSVLALLPRKRKRRDPRPVMLITDVIHKDSTLIEPDSTAQNIPSPVTESTPVIQEISSPLPESTPLDQDFQSPIIEEVVMPSKGAQASGNSFETPELDISKGKMNMPESEFLDVALLQNRVFV
ncbi:unnamed protein product [Lactuca virosa]|uniref:Uncharacterized protein n=1 Tax=Lactuca virosa TaxID=75947 RepID=A0AAU9PS03_9ASTR|nr:unnamed protein product [Lactuca virosa]